MLVPFINVNIQLILILLVLLFGLDITKSDLLKESSIIHVISPYNSSSQNLDIIITETLTNTNLTPRVLKRYYAEDELLTKIEDPINKWKHVDQNHFRIATNKIFLIIFPQNFNEVVYRIINSGYSHNENIIFLVTIDSGLEKNFMDHTYAYAAIQEKLFDFQVTLIINIIQHKSSNGLLNKRWYLYCHLCPLPMYKFILFVTSNMLTLSMQNVTRINQLYNWNGYGSQAIIEGAWGIETIGIEKCMLEPYRVKFDYKDYHILFWIISQKLNFTIKPVNNNITTSRVIGLKISTESKLDPYSFVKNGTWFYLNGAREIGLVYCTPTIQYESRKWTFLLQPFDYYVWICILLIIIVSGLVNQSIWIGFDIFWLTIGQQIQNRQNWTRRYWIIHLPFILLTVIANGYLGIMTRNVIAPIPEETFQTISELIDASYKYVHGDNKTISYLKQRVMPKGIMTNRFEEHCCIINSSSSAWSVDPYFMTRNKGFVYRVMNQELDKPIFEQRFVRKDTEIKCHIVKERMHNNYLIYWTMRSYLAEIVYNKMQSLTLSGITAWWYKMTLKHRKANALFQFKSATIMDWPRPLPLFESQLIIVFQLFFICLGVSLIIFITEILVRLISNCRPQ